MTDVMLLVASMLAFLDDLQEKLLSESPVASFTSSYRVGSRRHTSLSSFKLFGLSFSASASTPRQ